MNISEPSSTAVLLSIFGALMAFSVLFSRAAERIGVPVVLLFMVLGMLAGSDGLGVQFDDYEFAFRIGTLALVLILFDGGLNTPYSVLRQGIAPATVLATAGVLGTAAMVALAAWQLRVPVHHAMLLGAIVSSTDAAAVFAVLRGSRLNLQKRVGITLEVESCINDPMAIILTMAITEALVTQGGTASLGWTLLLSIPAQLVIGTAMGVGVGLGAVLLLKNLHLRAGGLYPVVTLAIAMMAFGITTLVNGSGFVAVYVAAVIIGNNSIPYRNGLTRIHDAIAWLGQITMFLMLGLLVYPSRLVDVMWIGLGLGLFLALVARPVVVGLCLAPFRYPPREIAYIGWVGLRGAVPIILAIFPVMRGVPDADRIFNIVFFIVVVSAIIPGTTLRWITRRLGLDVDEAPTPAAAIEINSTALVRSEILSFFIDESLAVSGVTLSKIRFPTGASIILIVRDQELIAARGNTVLKPGDHVFVFCQPEDRPFIELLFGKGASA
jgi:cell volume regulation protein A